MVKARLIVIDEDGGRDVHRVTQNEAFFYPALPQARLNLGRDVDECPPGGHMKPKLFAIALHPMLLSFMGCLPIGLFFI
jgi:hypothetical protein